MSPPPYRRRIWFYDRANATAINKSIEMFPWKDTSSDIVCPNLQVKSMNEALLNIFSNFIPNKIITVRSRQAPWITQSIKNFIRKKNRAHKTFTRNGQPENRLEAITNMIIRGSKLIEDAKDKYFTYGGPQLPRTNTKRIAQIQNESHKYKLSRTNKKRIAQIQNESHKYKTESHKYKANLTNTKRISQIKN